MSTVPTAAITLVYLLPVALVALLLTTRWLRSARWLLPSVLLALPAFYVGHYLILQQMQGWPSKAPLPTKFELLAFDITEPDPNTGRSGQILLWINAGDDDQPRVHRLGYQKDLHQELVAAGQRQAQGRPQVGTRGTGVSAAVGSNAAKKEVISFRDKVGRSLPSKP